MCVWGGLSVFIDYSARKEPSESVQFQGLPEAISNCIPFLGKELSFKMESFKFRENCHATIILKFLPLALLNKSFFFF